MKCCRGKKSVENKKERFPKGYALFYYPRFSQKIYIQK